MAALPHRDSPEIHLVVSTPEEIIAQQHANSDEWRGALALPAYLRREELLADQTLTRDGGLTGWSLVYQPAGSDEKNRQVLCGCETIKKRALVASGNTVEAVTAHGVCSVFCPPQHRGKGYAGRMIADLGEKLKTWQSNGQNNLFSVLWSDIGKVRSFVICPFLRLKSRSSPCRNSTLREAGRLSHRPTFLSLLGQKRSPTFLQYSC
jgi:hypothetical protein